MTGTFASVEEARTRLGEVGYLPSEEIATAAFLGDRMAKPILVEGPAGVGKTELALALSRALGRELVRLQCYEGLDESKALYEWEYAKQLLYTQLLRDEIGRMLEGSGSLAEAADRVAREDAIFFSERFLLPRPLLRALRSERPSLLLVDELDKADPEFEAFLLEVLSDYAVTIPELGTLRAVHTPRVVLTSNNTRELSDALKRRCLHLYIDFPSRERELAILRTREPGLSEALGRDVVTVIHRLRNLDLKKAPSVSETLDWAMSLTLLNADRLSPELLTSTLGLLLKHRGDLELAQGRLGELTGELSLRG